VLDIVITTSTPVVCNGRGKLASVLPLWPLLVYCPKRSASSCQQQLEAMKDRKDPI
jgi:hypothetical protein